MNIKDLLKDAYKDGMTLEEIEKALEGVAAPKDNSDEVEKLKTSLSKANSEAADFKRQLKEKMSAEEIKAKEDAEAQEKLQKDYDALLRKVTVSENKAKLLALGYEDKLADETAEAIANGENDKVFTNQRKHMEALEKKIRADVLKETPKPGAGNGGNADVTKEQFDKMGYADRAKLFTENKELYEQLTNENGGTE